MPGWFDYAVLRFPDTDGGFMDTGNYRRQVLHRLAKNLELPKLTF
jgi:hypothetical protein